MEGQRLDKWLWCARLVKTRSLAAKLIEGGKVRINGERALKVSRHVRLGDVVTGNRRRRRAPLRGAGLGRGRAARTGADRPLPLRGSDAGSAAFGFGCRADRGASREAADQARPQASRGDQGRRTLRCRSSFRECSSRPFEEQLLALYWCRDWDRQNPSSGLKSGDEGAATKGRGVELKPEAKWDR